jgi:hypothetical protein
MNHNAKNSAHIDNPNAIPIQKPTNPFPAWRLPNGIINAGKEELERSIGSCERWGWFGGGLVVMGVAGEVAIAAYHPSYDSFLEQWGSAIANGFVAIGVAAEILFGRMAGLRQSELIRRSDEKAAEANARTAELQKENLRLRAAISWREIAPADLQRLTALLASVAPSEVIIEYVRGDPESQNAAGYFLQAFRAANWRVTFRARTPAGAAAGLWVLPNATQGPSTDRSVSIVTSAFSSIGLDFGKLGGFAMIDALGETWGQIPRR